jgi:hypothetical protein
MSNQVFAYLGQKVKSDQWQYKYCSVMIDAMCIRRHIEYDSGTGSMVGFVDLGSGPVENDEATAREALVIMAVGLAGHWKVPLGYVLIDGITADVQKELVLMAISKLGEVGIRAVAIVMDGHQTNQSMAKKLGCSFDGKEIISSFEHPSGDDRVYVFFDACHMLKNIRNALHAEGVFRSEKLGEVRWEDLVKLQDLQATEGLRAANKLTSKHIRFSQKKMSVKLAAQTLSSSVAKSLEFVSEINIDGFENCTGTASFIAMVDRLFDIFNSRSPYARGYKQPINQANYQYNKKFLLECKQMLLEIKGGNGVELAKGRRKISFLGFVVNIQSLLDMGRELLLEKKSLKYLLTYKVSQDHLELFFSAVRRMGGFNNNPSARQFSSAYRSLISHAGVLTHADGTNCIPQDKTSLLNVDPTETTTVSRYVDNMVDHSYSSSLGNISPFVDGVLEYIAGWVIRKIEKKVGCEVCCQAMLATPDRSIPGSLVTIRNNGGLKVPSTDVVKVIRHVEKTLRSQVNIKSAKHWEWNGSLITNILATAPDDLFQHLNRHFLETSSALETHYTSLIRLICAEFVRLRRFHVVNLTNSKFQENSIRHKRTKEILFRNQ